MDRFELIFAIIFILLGLVKPISFLAGLLFLWVGYGKKIHIFTAKNVFKIPTSGEGELFTMLDNIKQINPNIFIKNS